MIYLLKRIIKKDKKGKVVEGIGYDEYDSKVVRAVNEHEARDLANQNTGDEGPLWTDSKRVQCVELKVGGPSEEILGSFNAG